MPGVHAESAGSYITGAFAREKPCFQLFGGGIVHFTKSDGGFLSSPKPRGETTMPEWTLFHTYSVTPAALLHAIHERNALQALRFLVKPHELAERTIRLGKQLRSCVQYPAQVW
jgi:hypothetical protein